MSEFIWHFCWNFLGWFETTKYLTNDDHRFLNTAIFVSESLSLISLCTPLIITASNFQCLQPAARRGQCKWGPKCGLAKMSSRLM